MSPSWQVQDYGRGQALIVRSWDAESALAVSQTELPVVFNAGRGWDGDHLEFLRGTTIHNLQIICYTELDLTPLLEVQGLKSLTLECIPSAPIDLCAFSDLEEFTTSFYEYFSTILNSDTLRKVALFGRLPFPDLHPFHKMSALRCLKLSGGNLGSLDGIDGFADSLRVLELAAFPRLSSLEGIELATSLEELWIEKCRRIHDLTLLANLMDLRMLDLSNMGEIDSLMPIQDLTQLEKVFFVESTNILDGNLFPLAKLPKLGATAFMERCHYSHTQFLGFTEKLIRKPWRFDRNR